MQFLLDQSCVVAFLFATSHSVEALQSLWAIQLLPVQERSTSGRTPAKLKLACKQGGREQQTHSYSLPFPYTAASQLRATALGSVNPAVAQSSAVHTLIPNLAPRSRLQQQRVSTSSGSSSSMTIGGQDAVGVVSQSGQMQLPGAEEFLSREAHSSCEDAGKLLKSGCHQSARQAIFEGAMSLLRPKLAEPVLVNFMSVAGMFTFTFLVLYSMSWGPTGGQQTEYNT